MGITLTLGYRRHPDGSAVPICDPCDDSFTLFLWQHSALVTFYSPLCVATGMIGSHVTVKGRMEPARLLDFIRVRLKRSLDVLSFVSDRIAKQYPMEMIVDCVSGRYGNLLYASLDRPFVEIEPPPRVTNGFVHVERPRIVIINGRARLVITGNDREFPLWQWADAILRERVEEAVLNHVTNACSSES